MKAITLHQPWASLIVLGIKRIETRAWPTSHRGPLAIHAGTRKPTVDEALLLHKAGVCSHLEVPFVWAKQPLIPFGAVVATCTLAGCLPIVGSGEEGAVETVQADPDGSLWRVEPEDDVEDWPQETHDITDQRPYGDFTPGRWAWLLDDIKPVDPPVPARGRQRLWNWDARPEPDTLSDAPEEM